MTLVREPRLHPIPVMCLRPTQITVGMREVDLKRKSWRDHPDSKKSDFLGRHLIPVIWGPKGEYYVIDHHHLALALHREGVKQIATTVVADLRALPRPAFWVYLDNRGWLHPYDDKGERRTYKDIPKKITGLIDDPYRSLAGELRLKGGFAKDTTPFSEFLWADFLRRRIKRKVVEKDFDRALTGALNWAKSPDAGYLPGWCGPSDRLERSE
ncbi:MAG: hypothetical protein JOZ58_03980 [Acetobacteraceae bacterium]|nr:hypothetical protein [Acetobacteraceae bacterium]